MMPSFKVWREGDRKEEEADEITMYNAEMAAVRWVKDNCFGPDYPEEVSVSVREIDGPKTCWLVNTELLGPFHVTQLAEH